MIIKLGPYKIQKDLWLRIQQLPGNNDEQRVIGSLRFACDCFEEKAMKAAMHESRIAELVAQEIAKSTVTLEEVAEIEQSCLVTADKSTTEVAP